MKGIVRVIVQICGRFFTAIAEQWKDIHEEWLLVEIESFIARIGFHNRERTKTSRASKYCCANKYNIAKQREFVFNRFLIGQTN